MLLSRFRAVIFDCDGVLVDSEMLGLRSLQGALREHGVELPLESLARFSGRSHAETLTQLESESGTPLTTTAVAARMDEIFMQLAGTDGLRLCPGVPELLAWLATSQIPYTLASSGPRRKVAFNLRGVGLLDRFPGFLCAEDVRWAKPAPDLYLAAAARIGVPPAESLVIEDAPNGIRAAHAAGMQVVGVTTTFTQHDLEDADVVVDSLSTLPGIFSELLEHRRK
jgi:beta-phosphoglucomutase-like phosphatase (HAD superfamily)